jgi:diguanylate cyclase (GGDEF)-like protein
MPAPATPNVAVGDLESQVRARIDALSYLPTTAAVAMKFIDLGKDPEASPGDYVKVISSDSSLSTKLLALANSSWFGVRNRVTKVQVAVNLLGLGTVRTMAISYCLTGLHSELRLKPEESKIFWAASLCKAVAAKQLAARIDPKLGEEAFAAGLFQDFAIPIMFSVSREKVMAVLGAIDSDLATRIQEERAAFRMDHAEMARAVALKLELPEVFVDAVAYHHDRPGLNESLPSPTLADAVYGAGLFPHVLETWNKHDARELRSLLASLPKPVEPNEFLESVQKEFNQLYAYFEQGDPPETRLTEILEAASREAAETTARLVGTVQQLMNQAASAGKEMDKLLKQQDSLHEAAAVDKLTGALNREAFKSKANELLASADQDPSGYALAFVDIDRFKQVNDTLGHSAGDAALRRVAAAIKESIKPSDVAGRFGGDEFVVLLNNYSDTEVAQTINKITHAARSQSGSETPGPEIQLSVGIIYVPHKAPVQNLDTLIAQADTFMYQSKRAGGNRASAGRVRVKPMEKVA